jgi:hypothetical protein
VVLALVVLPLRIVAQESVTKPDEIVGVKIRHARGIVLIRISNRQRQLITLKYLNSRDPRPGFNKQVELTTNVRLA